MEYESKDKMFMFLTEYTEVFCCMPLSIGVIILHVLSIIMMILLQIIITKAYFPFVMMILSYIFFSLWIVLSLVIIIEVILKKNFINGFVKRTQEIIFTTYLIGGLFYGLGLGMLFWNKSDPIFDYYIGLYYIIWGFMLCFEVYVCYITYSQYKQDNHIQINDKDALLGDTS